MSSQSTSSSSSSNPTTLSRLEKLKLQREKLNARIQATEARDKVASRKQDTRRKILVGSYYLDKAIQENTMADLKKIMRDYLTRESDLRLFEWL